MANVMDYLSWRGDLDMGRDPWSAVDALAMANLCYLDFLETSDERGCTLAEACRRHLNKPSPVANFEGRFRQFQAMAESQRFGGIRMHHFLSLTDEEQGLQFSATCYDLPDGTLCIGFRGTDSTIVGWKEDFALSYLTETPGQRHAVEFLNDVFSFAENAVNALPRLYVGGHSKGGNLAVYASAFAEPSIRKRIHTVFSNDGPGFREEIIHNPAYLEILPKIVSIIPESSLIGGLLDSHADNQIIKSSENGIRQHNAMSWEVLGTDFVRAERSVMGRFFDESVHSWLSGITDAERAAFTDSLFEVLEAGGARTVEDLKSNPLRTAGEMIKASLNMDSDKRREFTDLVLQLMASGANTIKEQTQEAAFKTGRGKSRKMRRLPNPENRQE